MGAAAEACREYIFDSLKLRFGRAADFWYLLEWQTGFVRIICNSYYSALFNTLANDLFMRQTILQSPTRNRKIMRQHEQKHPSCVWDREHDSNETKTNPRNPNTDFPHLAAIPIELWYYAIMQCLFPLPIRQNPCVVIRDALNAPTTDVVRFIWFRMPE